MSALEDFSGPHFPFFLNTGILRIQSEDGEKKDQIKFQIRTLLRREDVSSEFCFDLLIH